MDTQMHELEVAPQLTTNNTGSTQHTKSYLLSFLQKSDFFTSQNPRTFSDLQRAIDSTTATGHTPSSRDSSLRSSSPIGSHDDDLSDGVHDEDDDDDYDDDEDNYVDPDDLTNLPYKSPDVNELPGARMKYRTLVRDAPAGTAQGEVMRYVVIGKRSFRGAGLWPEKLVRRREDGWRRRSSGMDVDPYPNEHDEGDVENEEEGFDGEVEVMCSDDGEEFWLVRDPTEDGSIGKQTSWVSREWFKRRKAPAPFERKKHRDQVELRVMMDED